MRVRAPSPKLRANETEDDLRAFVESHRARAPRATEASSKHPRLIDTGGRGVVSRHDLSVITEALNEVAAALDTKSDAPASAAARRRLEHFKW